MRASDKASLTLATIILILIITATIASKNTTNTLKPKQLITTPISTWNN